MSCLWSSILQCFTIFVGDDIMPEGLLYGPYDLSKKKEKYAWEFKDQVSFHLSFGT